jgi:hypothetical protein
MSAEQKEIEMKTREEQWEEEEKVKALIRQSPSERFWGFFNFIVAKLDLAFLAGLFVFLSNVGGVLKDLLMKVVDYVFPVASVLKGLDLATYFAKFLNARNKNFGKLFNLTQKALEFAAITTAVVVAHYSLFSVTMFGVVIGGGVVIFAGVMVAGLAVLLAKTIGFAIAAKYYEKSNPALSLKYEQKARTNLLFSILIAASLGVMITTMMFPALIPLAIVTTVFTLAVVVFAAVVIVCKDTPLGGKLYKNIVEPVEKGIKNFIENGLSKKNDYQKVAGLEEEADSAVTKTSTEEGEFELDNTPRQRASGYFAALGAPREGKNLDNAMTNYRTQLNTQISNAKNTWKEKYFWSENDKRLQKILALEYVGNEVNTALQDFEYTGDKKPTEPAYQIELRNRMSIDDCPITVEFRTKDELRQKIGDHVTQLFPKSGQSFFRDTARFDELFGEHLDQVFEDALKRSTNSNRVLLDF